MDFGEFYKWWKDPVTESKLAACKQRMADVKDRFDEVDADGSDALDREEVRTLCEKLLGVPITEAQLDEGMGEMDRDNSGEVDFHEFYGARKLGFERIRTSPRALEATCAKLSRLALRGRVVGPEQRWAAGGGEEGRGTEGGAVEGGQARREAGASSIQSADATRVASLWGVRLGG